MTIDPDADSIVKNQRARIVREGYRARWYEWESILRAAESDPILDDMIKQVEAVYEIKK